MDDPAIPPSPPLPSAADPLPPPPQPSTPPLPETPKVEVPNEPFLVPPRPLTDAQPIPPVAVPDIPAVPPSPVPSGPPGPNPDSGQKKAFSAMPFFLGGLVLLVVAGAVFGFFALKRGGFGFQKKASSTGYRVVGRVVKAEDENSKFSYTAYNGLITADDGKFCTSLDSTGYQIGRWPAGTKVKLTLNLANSSDADLKTRSCKRVIVGHPCLEGDTVFNNTCTAEIVIKSETCAKAVDEWQNHINWVVCQPATCQPSVTPSPTPTVTPGGPSLTPTATPAVAACASVAVEIAVPGRDINNLQIGDTVSFTATFSGAIEDVAVDLRKGGVSVKSFYAGGLKTSTWTTPYYTIESVGSYEVMAFIKTNGVWK